MPVSIRDWLPGDHLAWLVLDVVDQLELGPIRARYRADGWGAAAFDPALMTALLLYAYATGERSSRRIEERCRIDVAYRVICANQVPDHATIARFRADHEAALGDLFVGVLRLCGRAGLGAHGLLAIDGTKLAADASERANRRAPALDAEIRSILAEAAEIDAAEDAAYGPERRGDELSSSSSRWSRRPGRTSARQGSGASGWAPSSPTPATGARRTSPRSRPSAWRRSSRPTRAGAAEPTHVRRLDRAASGCNGAWPDRP